jgi:glycosyltransferase involved in cell wall biosynthesis
VKAFFWSADENACGYYRCGLPAAELARRGHETLATPRMPADWMVSADVFVGQRVCMPAPSTTWRRLALEGRHLVCELDDDLFRVDPSSPAHSVFSGQEIQARIRGNLALAMRVTVTTEPLAAVVREFNPDVRVVPNMVPAALLGWERPRCGQVTVGWSGSATHQMDLEEVVAPLRQFARRVPEARVHLMGADYRQLLRLPADQVRHTGWVGGVEDFHRAIDFDIGLAPLRPHVFNAAKSDIRIVELGALGIPVVASDYGPYAESVQHGVTGFLCRRPHQWVKALTELARDEGMRVEMGAAGRKWASTRTIEGNGHLWAEALS